METAETRIYLRRFGSGSPVLLLHGFPETHLMWRHVAPSLAERYTVICPDLRGYGRSGCPESRSDHAPYAKRAMANDMVSVRKARKPQLLHACEEYRAAATLDHDHDVADREAGRRIECPVLVLWSGRGPLNVWYRALGGPIALWRAWADDVEGEALDAGHFFPEEIPEQTTRRLSAFFGGTRESRFQSSGAVLR